MKFCKKCLAADTVPGRTFLENGICYACYYHDSAKEVINWQEREQELQEIVKWAKANNICGYDAAIGVSGGKDSTFQALYARDVLKLNPLLVRLEPDAITEAGRHNIENLVNHGFDLVSWRNNPVVMKKLTKRAFYEFGNPIKPSEYPLWAVTVQTAIAYKIPLIIQGENPGLTLGNTKGVGTDGNALNVVKGNTVQGGNADVWLGDGIEKKDLILYQFPDEEKIKNAGLKAIYLQYYYKDWSPEHNVEFSVKNGLIGREEIPGRMSRFASVDSDLQVLNPMFKYLKFGTSNYSESLSSLIRKGEISREEAALEAEKYDGYCPEKYIHDFCSYINISAEEFWTVMENKWINKKLFYKDSNGKWQKKFKVGIDYDGQ